MSVSVHIIAANLYCKLTTVSDHTVIHASLAEGVLLSSAPTLRLHAVPLTNLLTDRRLRLTALPPSTFASAKSTVSGERAGQVNDRKSRLCTKYEIVGGNPQNARRPLSVFQVYASRHAAAYLNLSYRIRQS